VQFERSDLPNYDFLPNFTHSILYFARPVSHKIKHSKQAELPNVSSQDVNQFAESASEGERPYRRLMSGSCDDISTQLSHCYSNTF